MRFEVDAPLCSGVQFRLRFSIDESVVGEDTLMHGQSSVAFATDPGPHALHAEILNVPTSRDTSVTLVPGERFRMLLEFYCS